MFACLVVSLPFSLFEKTCSVAFYTLSDHQQSSISWRYYANANDNFTVTKRENDAAKKKVEGNAANLVISFIPRINAFLFSQSTFC